MQWARIHPAPGPLFERFILSYKQSHMNWQAEIERGCLYLCHALDLLDIVDYCNWNQHFGLFGYQTNLPPTIPNTRTVLSRTNCHLPRHSFQWDNVACPNRIMVASVSELGQMTICVWMPCPSTWGGGFNPQIEPNKIGTPYNRTPYNINFNGTSVFISHQITFFVIKSTLI